LSRGWKNSSAGRCIPPAGAANWAGESVKRHKAAKEENKTWSVPALSCFILLYPVVKENVNGHDE
jgi:hypothetical protein